MYIYYNASYPYLYVHNARVLICLLNPCPKCGRHTHMLFIFVNPHININGHYICRPKKCRAILLKKKMRATAVKRKLYKSPFLMSHCSAYLFCLIFANALCLEREDIFKKQLSMPYQVNGYLSLFCNFPEKIKNINRFSLRRRRRSSRMYNCQSTRGRDQREQSLLTFGETLYKYRDVPYMIVSIKIIHPRNPSLPFSVCTLAVFLSIDDIFSLSLSLALCMFGDF